MTTETECLEALREAARRLGESPTKAQYEELALRPASATIIRNVGGWNEAKARAGLETAPSTGSRVEPKPPDVELPPELDWEELTVDQRWHYRNAEWNAERTLRRRARLRRWLNERKRDAGCASCGNDTAARLDFHHETPQEKTMAVGRMVTYGHGREALREEIEKCTILCANCHRRRHFTPPKRTQSRRWWVWERKLALDGCARCDVRDPACLEFHHVEGEKQTTVARLLSDGRPLRDVRTEMAKCELLCANCHRIEHYRPPAAGLENDRI
ncbi:homing endonuclease associated repeat-containing protein [Natrialbaceae archaeon GCM10025810]|uniref:homing endonuclease associated repeat-containing protein n=1 Tax=Halovalidus salilacus TaxID=3075124 RepID=UPI0036139EE7